MEKEYRIKCPVDVTPLIKKYVKRKQECFGVICLDSDRKVISLKMLFKGGVASCGIDQKVLFWYALRKLPSGIIVFHNHPSGNPNPSDADIKMTDNLKKSCDILGLSLLDHVIIGRYGYYSFLENGNVLGDSNVQRVAEV